MPENVNKNKTKTKENQGPVQEAKVFTWDQRIAIQGTQF